MSPPLPALPRSHAGGGFLPPRDGEDLAGRRAARGSAGVRALEKTLSAPADPNQAAGIAGDGGVMVLWSFLKV